jgi:hypothetical protein
MKISLVLATTLVLVTLVSCQKELTAVDSEKNFARSGVQVVTEKISDRDWRFVTAMVTYSDGEIDNGPLEECKTDDIERYESDGSATIIYGTVPCGHDLDNGKYASWELLLDGTQLREVYTRDLFGQSAGDVELYNVDFINDNKLIISRTLTEPGKSFIETSTYRR